MSDQLTCIAELKEKIKAFATEREWQRFHSPKNLSMAIAVEASELMEHFLWVKTSHDFDVLKDTEKSSKIREEIADILIFAMQFANVTGIDISRAIADKMKQNACKYPVEKSRGKSLKYDEL